MWELDHKEGWALRNWCFWTVVLKKTLESPLDCKEIKPVNCKGNQPWIFIGRTDAEAVPILWPPEMKGSLIRKDPDAGKDWRQEEKGMTEDKMVGWRHWLYGYEFEQAHFYPCDYQFSIIIYCRDCSFFVDYLGTYIKINGSCTCGSTSGLSCLFYWSILLPVPRCLDHSFDYLVSK